MSSFEFPSNLTFKNGIYFSDQTDVKLSYPQEGNQLCYQLEENSFWFEHRNNAILFLVKQFSHKKTFFDVGGGNGFVAKHLQDKGMNSVLIEPGIQGVMNAKKRGVKNVICSTLENAGFSNGYIDALGLFDVVEHIKDDGKFLGTIFQALEKGGFVYLTVPAYQFLWSNEDEDAGHFRRYTVKSISQVLRENGFEIEFSSYIFSFLIIPLLLFRTIPSKLGFNKNSNNPEKHEKEHQAKKGLTQSIIDIICKLELSRIKKLKTIPFGTSCFIIARKN